MASPVGGQLSDGQDPPDHEEGEKHATPLEASPERCAHQDGAHRPQRYTNKGGHSDATAATDPERQVGPMREEDTPGRLTPRSLPSSPPAGRYRRAGTTSPQMGSPPSSPGVRPASSSQVLPSGNGHLSRCPRTQHLTPSSGGWQAITPPLPLGQTGGNPLQTPDARSDSGRGVPNTGTRSDHPTCPSQDELLTLMGLHAAWLCH